MIFKHKKEPSLELLQEESLSHKLIKKGFWLYFFSYLMAPIGYFIRLIVSNSPEVSVADLGIMYSIISLIGFLNIYNDLGLTETLQYFLPRFWIKKQFDYVKTSIYLSLGVQIISAVLIALVLWTGSDWLALHYFHTPVASEILKYFCLYFLGINLFQTLQSVFIAFQKTFENQLVDFVKILATFSFTLFFFLTGKGTIQWYALSWILGLLIGIIVALWIYKKQYHSTIMQGKRNYDKTTFKSYFNYAVWAFLGINIGNLFGQILQQLVLYFLGPESSGYYSNFLSLFGIAFIILGPILSLIFPMVSEIIERKDSEKLRLLSAFFYSYPALLVISFSLLYLIFGVEISLLLFGERFLASGKLLVIGGGFLFFHYLSSFNFSVMGGMGAIKERIKILFGATITMIVSALLGIQLWGITGAVLSFGVGYLVLRALSFRFIQKKYPFQPYWRFIIKNLLLFGVLGLTLRWIKPHIFLIDLSHRWQGLFQMGIIIVIFYLIFGLFNLSQFKRLKKIIYEIKNQ